MWNDDVIDPLRNVSIRTITFFQEISLSLFQVDFMLKFQVEFHVEITDSTSLRRWANSSSFQGPRGWIHKFLKRSPYFKLKFVFNLKNAT